MSRKFDVTIRVEKIADSTQSNFAIILESIFEDNDLHEFYRDQPDGQVIADEEDSEKYIRMVYEFLKRNLEMLEK